MAASEAAVKAAEAELGCEVKWPGKPWATCRVAHHSLGNWTERGCPIAVAVADAVAVIAAREALLDAAATLAPPDPHDEDEECETCWTVRWLRTRAETIR